VRRHPGWDRNALYIAAHASHIVGMPVEEGQALLAELIEFATQPHLSSSTATNGRSGARIETMSISRSRPATHVTRTRPRHISSGRVLTARWALGWVWLGRGFGHSSSAGPIQVAEISTTYGEIAQLFQSGHACTSP
jgi:hypothetical protein